jgi:hypothetical protein
MKRTEQICLPLFVWLALISGCAVGPNYKQPQTAVAASFANSPTNAVAADEADARDRGGKVSTIRSSML